MKRRTRHDNIGVDVCHLGFDVLGTVRTNLSHCRTDICSGRNGVSGQDDKIHPEVGLTSPPFLLATFSPPIMKLYLKEEITMKKFSFGLLGLCVLVGSHFGSVYGIAIAFCAFMVVDGLFEELRKGQARKANEEKEVKQNA